MKFIDTHLHFWDLSNKINSWVLDQTDSHALKQNFLPDTLFANKELVGVVHVEAHDSSVPTLEEVVWLSNIMQNHKGVKYAHIAFADITLPLVQFAATIDEIKEYSCIKGVRHILSHTPKYKYNPCNEDISGHKNILANLQYLKQNNLIFDCQMYPYQLYNVLPHIIKSGVKCVVDHFALPAWDNHHDQQLWQNLIIELAKIRHISLKLSGLDMFQVEARFADIIDFCLSHFSSEQLLFASNYPVSYTNNYNYWYNYLNSHITDNNLKQRILLGNAADLFF